MSKEYEVTLGELRVARRTSQKAIGSFLLPFTVEPPIQFLEDEDTTRDALERTIESAIEVIDSVMSATGPSGLNNLKVSLNHESGDGSTTIGMVSGNITDRAFHQQTGVDPGKVKEAVEIILNGKPAEQ
jgi:hypothetical protein